MEGPSSKYCLNNKEQDASNAVWDFSTETYNPLPEVCGHGYANNVLLQPYDTPEENFYEGVKALINWKQTHGNTVTSDSDLDCFPSPSACPHQSFDDRIQLLHTDTTKNTNELAHLVTYYKVQHTVLDEQRLTDVTTMQEQFERAEAESAELKTQYLRV